MKKLILQMHITVDGFVAGPNGELDWMEAEMDTKQLHILQGLTESMDTILLGRKMAEGFTTYWESVVDNQPESPEYSYAKIFVNTPKIVFSKTTNSLPGKNVTVENGDLIEAVNNLKKRTGKNIIVYGGANFVSKLIKHDLIDELYLFVNPVTIGEGLRVFEDRKRFKLVSSTACNNGIVVNQFRAAFERQATNG
ncbi:MAG: dihydrofolate reductase [Sphingobacteriales bacterium]|nr:MAG: dihydrofolate reductase [Sphingobacteriales bacterium]